MALLCTLRLLQTLPGPAPRLDCICFGTPAIGNAALAALVKEKAWAVHILNFILPGQLASQICAASAVAHVLIIMLTACTSAAGLYKSSVPTCRLPLPYCHGLGKRSARLPGVAASCHTTWHASAVVLGGRFSCLRICAAAKLS